MIQSSGPPTLAKSSTKEAMRALRPPEGSPSADCASVLVLWESSSERRLVVLVLVLNLVQLLVNVLLLIF